MANVSTRIAASSRWWPGPNGLTSAPVQRPAGAVIIPDFDSVSAAAVVKEKRVRLYLAHVTNTHVRLRFVLASFVTDSRVRARVK